MSKCNVLISFGIYVHYIQHEIMFEIIDIYPKANKVKPVVT